MDGWLRQPWLRARRQATRTPIAIRQFERHKNLALIMSIVIGVFYCPQQNAALTPGIVGSRLAFHDSGLAYETKYD